MYDSNPRSENDTKENIQNSKPPPDFKKIHESWSKKLEQRMTSAKKPSTKCKEFHFASERKNRQPLKATNDNIQKMPISYIPKSTSKFVKDDEEDFDSMIKARPFSTQVKQDSMKSFMIWFNDEFLKSRKKSQIDSNWLNAPMAQPNNIVENTISKSYSNQSKIMNSYHSLHESSSPTSTTNEDEDEKNIVKTLNFCDEEDESDGNDSSCQDSNDSEDVETLQNEIQVLQEKQEKLKQKLDRSVKKQKIGSEESSYNKIKMPSIPATPSSRFNSAKKDRAHREKVNNIITSLNATKLESQEKFSCSPVAMSNPQEQQFIDKVKNDIENTDKYLIQLKSKMNSQSTRTGAERMQCHLKHFLENKEGQNGGSCSKYPRLIPNFFRNTCENKVVTNVVTPLMKRNVEHNSSQLISRITSTYNLPQQPFGLQNKIPMQFQGPIDVPKTPNNVALYKSMVDTPSLVKSLRRRLTTKTVTQV